jgi:hypothetical protein
LWVKGIGESPEFAKELKFLNARKPQAIAIDPLSDSVYQICRPQNTNNYGQYRPSECVSEGSPYLNFLTQVGLKNLTLQILKSQLSFGLIESPNNDGPVQFLNDGGVTDEQIAEFKKSKTIQDLIKTVYKPGNSQLKIYLGFLAEEEYDAKVSVVTSDIAEHLGDFSGYRTNIAGISVRINRAYRNDPDTFAEAVSKILKNKRSFVFDDGKMTVHSLYKFRGGSGRRLNVERATRRGYSSEITLHSLAGAQLFRGLGLE